MTSARPCTGEGEGHARTVVRTASGALYDVPHRVVEQQAVEEEQAVHVAVVKQGGGGDGCRHGGPTQKNPREQKGDEGDPGRHN